MSYSGTQPDLLAGVPGTLVIGFALLSVLLQWLGKGCPSVFCPWRSGPNVFPVCSLLWLLFVCFRKDKMLLARGKLAHCLYTCKFSVHIVCIISYETTVF